MRDVEPIAGVRAAYEIERAARHVGRDYIRHAREAGHSWHDIGAALNITSGRDRETGAESISEAAFTYATGSPDTDFARRYGRSTREHGAPYTRLRSARNYAGTSTGQTTRNPRVVTPTRADNGDPRQSRGVGIGRSMRTSG